MLVTMSFGNLSNKCKTVLRKDRGRKRTKKFLGIDDWIEITLVTVWLECSTLKKTIAPNM
jgi:predicted nucleic acid-binding Zn ribbon protein